MKGLLWDTARGALAGALAFAVAACASMTVRWYSDSAANFARYRTYDWTVQDPEATGDPRLDNNPFVAERIRQATDRELRARGFEKSTTGTPDLMVHYHLSTSQRIDVSEIDSEYLGGRTTTPEIYEAGTLLLDFIDSDTKRLAWRGWADSSFEGIVDVQSRMEMAVDDAIAAIVKKLPTR